MSDIDINTINPADLRAVVKAAAEATVGPALARLQERVEEADRRGQIGAGPQVAAHILELLDHHARKVEPENAEFYGALSESVRAHAHERYPDHGFAREDETGEVTVTAKSGASITFESRAQMRAFRREHKGTGQERQWFGPGHTIAKGRGAYR